MKGMKNKALTAPSRDSKRAKVAERFATLSLAREMIVAGDAGESSEDDD